MRARAARERRRGQRRGRSGRKVAAVEPRLEAKALDSTPRGAELGDGVGERHRWPQQQVARTKTMHGGFGPSESVRQRSRPGSPVSVIASVKVFSSEFMCLMSLQRAARLLPVQPIPRLSSDVRDVFRISATSFNLRAPAPFLGCPCARISHGYSRRHPLAVERSGESSEDCDGRRRCVQVATRIRESSRAVAPPTILPEMLIKIAPEPAVTEEQRQQCPSVGLSNKVRMPGPRGAGSVRPHTMYSRAAVFDDEAFGVADPKGGTLFTPMGGDLWGVWPSTRGFFCEAGEVSRPSPPFPTLSPFPWKSRRRCRHHRSAPLARRPLLHPTGHSRSTTTVHTATTLRAMGSAPTAA